MKETNINEDPRHIIRQIICLIFEENINRYKEDKELVCLKYVTCWFLYHDGMLTDEYIDKIYPNIIDKDMINNNVIEIKENNTIKIKNLDKTKYKLWKSVINSDEYIDFINKLNGLF